MHDESMRSSINSIYLAGDVSGVEEASTAMEEGRIAGLSAAYSLGTLDRGRYEERLGQLSRNVLALRSGMFGQRRREAKDAIVASTRGEA